MSVRIVDHTPKILAKHRHGANLSIRMVMDEIDRQAFSKTPKDRGELRKNIRKQVGNGRGTMTWASSYAAYQERGYSSAPIRHYTTPGTGPRFAENAVLKASTRYPDLYFRSVQL